MPEVTGTLGKASSHFDPTQTTTTLRRLLIGAVWVYNGSPDTRFSRGMTRLVNWPDWERYLHPLQSLVVSLLLFFVSTLLFFRTRDVLSHRNSSTRRFPRFPPKNLYSLVMLAVSSLVYAATDTAFSKVLISLAGPALEVAGPN